MEPPHNELAAKRAADPAAVAVIDHVDDDVSLREWTIGVCVALLSLFASWIVFGEDLTHLLAGPSGAGTPTSAAQPTSSSTASSAPSKPGD